jgi:2-iminobutanoate/2-iminopropanoate deaminase
VEHTTNSPAVTRKNFRVDRRIVFAVTLLLFGGFVAAGGAFSKAPGESARRAINLPGKSDQLPFSDGILTGNTLYVAGRLGVDPKTGKAPAEVEEEVKLLLDGIKSVLGQGGMSMDDLVYVQIACTDLSLYEKFNGIYRGYFTTKDLPAREFIGAGSLLRGAHFELQAIAVKR